MRARKKVTCLTTKEKVRELFHLNATVTVVFTLYIVRCKVWLVAVLWTSRGYRLTHWVHRAAFICWLARRLASTRKRLEGKLVFGFLLYWSFSLVICCNLFRNPTFNSQKQDANY
jgi:hypothetical protein